MRVVKAQQQIGERGLAGAAGTDERDELAGLDGEVDVVRARVFRRRRNGRFRIECRRRRRGAFSARRFGDGIFRGEQFKDAFAGGARLGELVVQPRQVFHRAIHVKTPSKLDENRGMGTWLKGKVREHQGDAEGGEKFDQQAGHFRRAGDSHAVADQVLGRFLEFLRPCFSRL